MANALSNLLQQPLGHVGTGNEREDVDEDTFLIIHVKRITPFDEQRIEVANLNDRLFQFRIGFGRL